MGLIVFMVVIATVGKVGKVLLVVDGVPRVHKVRLGIILAKEEDHDDESFHRRFSTSSTSRDESEDGRQNGRRFGVAMMEVPR